MDRLSSVRKDFFCANSESSVDINNLMLSFNAHFAGFLSEHPNLQEAEVELKQIRNLLEREIPSDCAIRESSVRHICELLKSTSSEPIIGHCSEILRFFGKVDPKLIESHREELLQLTKDCLEKGADVGWKIISEIGSISYEFARWFKEFVPIALNASCDEAARALTVLVKRMARDGILEPGSFPSIQIPQYLKWKILKYLLKANYPGTLRMLKEIDFFSGVVDLLDESHGILGMNLIQKCYNNGEFYIELLHTEEIIKRITYLSQCENIAIKAAAWTTLSVICQSTDWIPNLEIVAAAISETNKETESNIVQFLLANIRNVDESEMQGVIQRLLEVNNDVPKALEALCELYAFCATKNNTEAFIMCWNECDGTDIVEQIAQFGDETEVTIAKHLLELVLS